jgi:hypothetical protein
MVIKNDKNTKKKTMNEAATKIHLLKNIVNEFGLSAHLTMSIVSEIFQ